MIVEPNVEIEQGDMFARLTMEYTPDQLGEIARRVAEDWEQEVESSILSRLGYVKVVRCRDCRRFVNNLTMPYLMMCNRTFADADPNGFCAWGERRADG